MKKKMAARVVDFVTSHLRISFFNTYIPRWLGQTAAQNTRPSLPSFDTLAAFNRIEAECRNWLAQGRTDLAMGAIQKLLLLDNKGTKAYNLLSATLLSETSYLVVLKHLHTVLSPNNYLEIGVNQGESMILTNSTTRAIGIDPVMRKNCRSLPNHIHLYTMTSDDFFAQMDLPSILDGQRLEMAFIDGMHLFEFALRDFIQVERHSDPRGIVLLHDTYPMDFVSASRKGVTGFWTGDVWKIIPCLKKYRPDLQIHTIAAVPSGLTIVQNLDPESRVLERHLHAIYDEFIYQNFMEFQQNMAATVHLFPADLDRITRELLTGAIRGL